MYPWLFTNEYLQPTNYIHILQQKNIEQYHLSQHKEEDVYSHHEETSICSHQDIVCDHDTDICRDCGLVLSSLHPMVPDYIPTTEALASLRSYNASARKLLSVIYTTTHRARGIVANVFFSQNTNFDANLFIDVSPGDPSALIHIYTILKKNGYNVNVREGNSISPITVLKKLFPTEHHLIDFQTHWHHVQDFLFKLFYHRERVLEAVYGVAEGDSERKKYTDTDFIIWSYFGYIFRGKEMFYFFWRKIKRKNCIYTRNIVKFVMEI